LIFRTKNRRFNPTQSVGEYQFWCQYTENRYIHRDVTSEIQKFDNLVAALLHESVHLILHVLENSSPTPPYSRMKARLLAPPRANRFPKNPEVAPAWRYGKQEALRTAGRYAGSRSQQAFPLPIKIHTYIFQNFMMKNAHIAILSKHTVYIFIIGHHKIVALKPFRGEIIKYFS
jgi:hypothetical protein